eukprot:6214509-Pleurochrysis_carterae.AAC.8
MPAFGWSRQLKGARSRRSARMASTSVLHAALGASGGGGWKPHVQLIGLRIWSYPPLSPSKNGLALRSQ